MTQHKLQVAQDMYASKQYTVAAIAKTLGVSRASIYRHLTQVAGRSALAQGERCACWSRSSGRGRGWVRTNDFCRVKRVRPRHATLRRLAIHHSRPGQRLWSSMALWWLVRLRMAALLTDC
jgi:hypothetical protein